MKRWLMSGCLMVVAAAASPGADRWQVYTNGEWVANASNDGDSFHVRCGRRTLIVRLYFVDAPETDHSVAGRVEEQAGYWGIGSPAAMRLGREAAQFTERALRRGFTVYTRREDAMGRSASPRYFAIVKVGDDYLCTMLVRHGLARIYGARTDMPDGLTARKYQARLRLAEKDARREGLGGWARTAAR